MVILDLTSSKTLAKNERPVGYAACANTQLRPIRMETIHEMHTVKKIPRLEHVNNPCNNTLRGQLVVCGKAKSVCPQPHYPICFSNSPNLPHPHRQ